MVKTALITGITGQDGSYLAEFLLSKNYNVHGIVRRTSNLNHGRIEHLLDNLTLHRADLTDSGSISKVIESVCPDEVYNLAAQSFVTDSFTNPISTSDITALGATRLLEIIKLVNRDIRFYQASSSEMFGQIQGMPQTENTPFYPRSPYGVSKLYAHWMTINYRESYDMFACSGILFNHESPTRGLEFVTRKITNAVAKIKLGKQEKLYLGNLESKRDWGFAGDYIKAMWLMLQQDKPDDYVIATGQTETVETFAKLAFSHVGLDYQDYIEIDPKLFRPAEVNVLCGDYSKAKKKLGWEPSTTLEELVKMMVDYDLDIEK